MTDEDALAAAPLNQLGGENAGLERLAEAHRVSDQNPRAWLLERLERRVELVGHQVHDTAVSQMNELVVRNTPAPVALQVQQRVVVRRARVRDELRVRRIEDLDPLFQLCQEECGPAADQVRDAVAGEQKTAVRCRVGSKHQPLLVPDDHA